MLFVLATLIVAVAGGMAFAAGPPPANDEPAAAEVISGLPVGFEGTTKGATKQGDEPFRGKAVWYRWEAPQAANAFIALEARSRGRIGLFTGAPGSLREISLDRATDYIDRSVSYWSAHKPLVGGEDYFIAVSEAPRGFSATVHDAVPKANARGRQSSNPYDLRIPVKLSAGVPAKVRLAGEIYVRPQSNKQEELWRLSPVRAAVRRSGSTRVRMRLPRKDRKRGCKAILYALTLKDVRGSQAFGRATFKTAAGKRSVVRWAAGIDELSSNDRSDIKHGRGRC